MENTNTTELIEHPERLPQWQPTAEDADRLRWEWVETYMSTGIEKQIYTVHTVTAAAVERRTELTYELPLWFDEIVVRAVRNHKPDAIAIGWLARQTYIRAAQLLGLDPIPLPVNVSAEYIERIKSYNEHVTAERAKKLAENIRQRDLIIAEIGDGPITVATDSGWPRRDVRLSELSADPNQCRFTWYRKGYFDVAVYPEGGASLYHDERGEGWNPHYPSPSHS